VRKGFVVSSQKNHNPSSAFGFRPRPMALPASGCGLSGLASATATFAPRVTGLQISQCWQVCKVVVSVSTSRSRDGLETYQRLVSVSSREKLSTSRSRLGLGHLRLVPKTNFRPNSAGHSTQCERALYLVNVCCSYYCSSCVKDNIKACYCNQ